MSLGRTCFTALAVLTLFLLLGNQSFVRHDRRPPTYDEAWYLEASLEMYHALVASDWNRFWYHYQHNLGPKAPLIAVLPLPFYLLLGPHHKPALLANSALLLLANLFLFLLVRRLYSPVAAVLAVLFYQTMPLVYGLSRTLLTEYALAALVIIWIYLLVVSDHLKRPGLNLLLGIVLGLGLLIKIIFPAFIAGPLLLSWWKGPRRLRPLAIVFLTAAAVASTWYAFHLRPVFEFAWSNAYGEIAAGYGAASLGARAVRFVNEGTSLYYAVAILALLPFALQRKPDERGLLLAWFLPPFAAIAVGRNLEIRFLAPLLPVLAIWLAAAVCRLAARPVPAAVLGLAIAALPLRAYVGHSVPSLAPREEIRLGSFFLSTPRVGLARVPGREGQWEQQRILAALDRLNPPGPTPRYALVGVEHPYLNADLLRYFNVAGRHNWRFTSLGYAETSVERAIERIHQLDAWFVIMAEGFREPDLPAFLNQINEEVQARLDRGELAFRLRGKVRLTEEVQAVLYEREAPWTRFPPGQLSERPSHPVEALFSGGVRFLGYDWKRRNAHTGEISCYWTVSKAVPEDYRVHVELAGDDSQVFLRQDHLVAGGRRPFYIWEPGEVVKQTMTLYAPAGRPLQARVFLTRWGSDAVHSDPALRLRLDE